MVLHNRGHMSIALALLAAATMTPGQIDYRDRRWRYIAKTRRALDGQQCTRCGARGRLHVHHKRAVSRGGGHALWNLTTLCAACHEQEHGFDIDGDGQAGRSR